MYLLLQLVFMSNFIHMLIHRHNHFNLNLQHWQLHTVYSRNCTSFFYERLMRLSLWVCECVSESVSMYLVCMYVVFVFLWVYINVLVDLFSLLPCQNIAVLLLFVHCDVKSLHWTYEYWYVHILFHRGRYIS